MLFAYLAAQNDRPVPRDELAELLWGDELPATWEKALRVLMTKLRTLLAECGIDGSTALTSAFGCYKLTLPAGAWIDVDAAVVAVERSEAALGAGDLDEARSQASAAAALARRSFLPGEEGPWVEERRRELRELLVRSLECLREASFASGEFAEAVRHAEEVVELEPFRESSCRRLMEAHASAGNPAEALRVYERCRRFLADELGAYPSPETEATYRGLLSGHSPESAPAEAAADPAVEPEPARPRPTRQPNRIALGAAAAILLLVTAAVAGVLATRGESSSGTTVAANAVGLIDAEDGRVRDQVAVGTAPTSVAFGHGAVWVTNADANTVSRIDPENRSVRQTIPVGNSPSGIAVGAGAIWVANLDDDTVSWINPESNTVVREIRVGHGPTAVAFDDGSLWVTNSHDRTLSRIDAHTGKVTAPRIRTGAVGRGIAVGAGSVWVTDEATRTVVQVDPGSNHVTSKTTVGGGPAAVVYGHGAVWVANELDGTVSEIDARTLATRAVIPIAGSPSALAFGAGSLWVSDEFGERVLRIDPSTRRESAALDVGNRPKGLAVVPAAGVWVAVRASGTGHRGGRLVVVGDQFDSIDPALASSTDSFALLGLAYDGLTTFRRVGGSDGTQLVADLAEALPLPTDGGRSYTFMVRTGVRYSDGTLLRAQDFRRALERMLAIGSPVLQGSALTKIVGAAGCKPGRPCDLSRGMIVGPHNTLTVRLSAADSRLLLSLVSVVPVPAGTPPTDVGSKPLPSTGPYTIDSYVPGRQLTVVRNRHFRPWSERARPTGYPDEIAWRIGVPRDKAIRQVIDGKADLVLNTVPADRVEDLAARYPSQVHLVPQRATAFVFLNTRRAPFDDVRVRQALNYAVDRRKMAELHGGSAVVQPTCQAVPPTVPGHRPYCPYTIDPDSSGEWKAPDLAKARELVAASGTTGQSVVVRTFPFFAKEARYFVSLLHRLGYRARLEEFQDIERYFSTLNRTPNVQAGFAGWFGNQLAADSFTTLTCDFAQNWAHFCDRRFDAAVNRLAPRQAHDPAAGAALAARLDREVVDRAPWVPLFTPRFADFTSKRVRNYQANTYASSSVLIDQLWVR